MGRGCIDLILWSREPTMKILRGGRRKGKLGQYVGLPLGTGNTSGAWTQNFFCVSCHAVSKHEQKAVINMAASRPSRSEIIQVESSRKIVDWSMKSIDKTAKSIGAFDSINYGVYLAAHCSKLNGSKCICECLICCSGANISSLYDGKSW